jgi:hypothetical protein
MEVGYFFTRRTCVVSGHVFYVFAMWLALWAPLSVVWCVSSCILCTKTKSVALTAYM